MFTAREELADASRLYKAYADPTRLRILSLLAEGELCVCRMIPALELPQSTISRHMAYLKSLGLVETRSEGPWNHYRLVKSDGGLPGQLQSSLTQCRESLQQLVADRKALKLTKPSKSCP